MSEQNKQEEKVYEAYTRYADKIQEKGYRFNPVYIASKALSDWLLLTNVDLKDKTVLNIGCAEPIDEIQFAEKVAKWTAIDINEKLIQMAQEIARQKLNPSLFSKLEFVQGDATALNFADNTFDIVVSFSTIDHIPQKEKRLKVFSEIARVLKPNGAAVITVPNKISTFYFAHRHNMRLGIADYGYAYLFTPWELKKTLLTVGLKPTVFASEYAAWMVLPSILPKFVPKILVYFQYFGERIGYLAVKTVKL